MEASPANAGAAINQWVGTFTVPPDGGCQQLDDRGNLSVTYSADGSAVTDLGVCPYSYGMLTQCLQNPPDPTADGSFFNAPAGSAITAACGAVCASLPCLEFGMAIAGPVPPGTGCCNQISGQQPFNFSVWSFRPPHVDYGLIPTQLIAANNPQFRYLANNNRVLLGLLMQQTRWAQGSCSSTRFRDIDDVCQSDRWSTDPYGVDPSFVVSSSLFQPGANMSAYYAPGEISPFGIPYGFFPDSPGGATFSVFFDINMRQDAAQARHHSSLLVTAHH